MSAVHALPRLVGGFSAQVPALRSPLRRLVAEISRWRRRHAAIRQLQALNDHYLADIGLERDRIVPTIERLSEARDRSA